MPYPTGAEIRGMLPYGASSNVLQAECDKFVSEWIDLIRQANPPKPNADGTPGPTPDTPALNRIVREGAWGDARKLQLVRDGHVSTPDADSALTSAKEALLKYDEENSAAGEPGPSVRLTPLPWKRTRAGQIGGWYSEDPGR